MGRRLPWKQDSDDDDGSLPPLLRSRDSDRNSAGPTPRRKRKLTAPAHHARPPSSSTTRSSSTSPPHSPPKEEFMRIKDDAYRMVEDELLLTAHHFTAHLHRAECQRLRGLAKSRGAAAMHALESSAVMELGPQQRQPTAMQIRRGGTSGGLRNLLESPAKDETSIMPYSTTRTLPATRATGVSHHHHHHHHHHPGGTGTNIIHRDGDDDDGDVEVVAATPRNTTPDTTRSRHVGNSADRSATRRLDPLRPCNTPTTTTSTTNKVSDDDDDDDDDDLFGIKKRRLRREKSRERIYKTSTIGNKSSSDSMPTFL